MLLAVVVQRVALFHQVTQVLPVAVVQEPLAMRQAEEMEALHMELAVVNQKQAVVAVVQVVALEMAVLVVVDQMFLAH